MELTSKLQQCAGSTSSAQSQSVASPAGPWCSGRRRTPPNRRRRAPSRRSRLQEHTRRWASPGANRG
eukprot:3396048-Alexandrium_andersonii.AAC.1